MFSVPDSVVEPHAGAVGGGRARRSLWVVPLVASIAFVTGVLVWAYRTEMDEQTERRSTMIADALSSEAQLRARLDTEMARLEDLGRHLATVPRNAAGLAGDPVVVEGLRGLWLSVTWLDSNNRIVAHVPDQQPLSGLRIKDLVDGPGVSSHLTLQAGGERLIVRYSPALLLRRGIPWWLTRKYDVQLVDASEQVIASVDEVPLRLESDGRLSYMVLVGGNMPGAYLELTSRELPLPLWRTLPLVLIGGFLALMLISTVLLRRQVRQITRAQDAWRTEAAWRQAMGDSALVGLRARDLEGRILYVNRTFCDMVGLPAQVLVGLMPPMPYWPPEVADEMALRNQRNLEGHAPREGYESLWRHQDGRLINVMVFESPLIDARGKQTGWMGSIIDITARKQLEERERHQAEAMAYQSRLTTLGEVASALAHQLNQPLTAIMGYNGGLQRMLGNPGYDVDAVRNALKNQGDQAAEAGRIVRRIREFLTRRGPQREACQLDAIARRAVELVQRDLKTRHIQVRWALAEDLPAVYADPILVEQVLINLVRNAADAMGVAGHGGNVRIASASAGQGFVRLDVEDDGPGLADRTIEQLSAPFYSTKADGMGMGLAICRSVIEVHHGGMDAGKSSLGGARFSFTLPVFDPVLNEESLAGEDARAAWENME
ncbi:MAG TPA: PAS domain S-box protein [Rhodoferax sp.]|nr:PAS domain S-box protein [Rhodoferax sp.]HOF51540.1 PAS domain S-box protein [Rhodoferax sp.]HQY75616.1 PAS domain S-box protein [Rhodoferax sp.]